MFTIRGRPGGVRARDQGQVSACTPARAAAAASAHARTFLATLPLALALTGCELAEVTIPDGEDVLVVEAILVAGDEVQQILLHRALNGRVVGGEEGARVRVRRGDGLEVVFAAAELSECAHVDPGYTTEPDPIEVRATCYISPEAAGEWVAPGERYELLIETAGGQRLHGRTTVPGHFALLGLSPGASRPPGQVGHCVLPPDSAFTLHWSVAAGAVAYMTHMRVSGVRDALAGSNIPNLPDIVELYGVSITERDTSIVVPGEVGVMEIGKYPTDLMLALRRGFPDGVHVRLTIGAMDRNYVTAVRGDNFNPSGLVRVSSIAGDGVGVFGSLVPYALEVRVGGAGEGAAAGAGAACLAG